MKKRFFTTSALFVMMALVATLSFAAEKKGAGEAGKPAAAKGAAAAKEQLADINTATEADLMAVPGIGDTYAKKIIAGRPYKGKNDLKKKNIVPADVYDQIKDKIIAKKPKK